MDRRCHSVVVRACTQMASALPRVCTVKTMQDACRLACATVAIEWLI